LHLVDATARGCASFEKGVAMAGHVSTKLFALFAVVSAATTTACMSLDGLSGGAPHEDEPPSPPAEHADAGAVGAPSPGAVGTVPPAPSGSPDPGAQDGGGPAAACPGLPLPIGVRVGTYCVDSTEVTNAHYQKFLAAVGTVPAPGTQPSFCSFNTEYASADAGAPPPDYPVVSVDWCDARAYCAWAGKRLCGKIGGGASSASTEWKDPKVDQWHQACTFGGTRTYPYGSTYDGVACNGSDAIGSTQQATATKHFALCQGGYAGVFDMSGNVREWQDSCAGTAGASDSCRTRGGAADNGELHLMCDRDEAMPRDYASARTGFRCCSL